MKTFAEAEEVLAQRLPGYESRPQQQKMARFIESALGERRHALAEAGCGTGKSLGAMIPAILSGERTVIATATIALMEQYCNKDVPFLSEHLGVPFTWALLKGRSNYVCQAKMLAPGAFIEPEKVAAVAAELEADQDHSGDREHLSVTITPDEFSNIATTAADCPGRKECPFGKTCFAEKAKVKAAGAQVVITNTAMLVTDLQYYGSMLGKYHNVIIDEAHELEDITTSMLEEVFRVSAVKRLAKDVIHFASEQSKVLSGDRVEMAMDEIDRILPTPEVNVKHRLGSTFFLDNGEVFFEMVAALKSMLDDIGSVTIIRNEERAKAFRTVLTQRVRNQIKRYTSLLTADDSDLVRWVEVEQQTKGKVKVLHFAPINVAPFLSETLWEREDLSAVLVSATLSVGGDFSFIQDRLGLGEAETMNVGTPFDYESQAMLFVPDATMPSPKNRAAWLTYSSTATMELIKAAGGGALLLFTSRSAMNASYAELAPRIAEQGFTTLIQGQGTNKENARLFTEDTHSVLFALKSFFTGVDIPGESLRLVVIDKLPFPVPSEPVFQARGDALKRQGKSDFSNLSMPMMTLTLVQGFGRLIRTKSDRGVVAILDSRLTSTGYGRKIVSSLPDSPATTSIEVVRSFFYQPVAV